MHSTVRSVDFKMTAFRFAIFGLAMMAVLLSSRAGDAERSVLDQLKAAGLRQGYDRARKRFVFVASAGVAVNPTVEKKFFQVRERLFRTAYLDAKGEVMRAFMTSFSASDEIVTEMRDGDEYERVSSFCEICSGVQVPGTITLCSAEAYDRKTRLYEVAVAVGWGMESCEMVREIEKNAMSGQTYGVDAEMKQWCSQHNLDNLMGCRRYVSSSGDAYVFAVGLADAVNAGKSPGQEDVVRGNAEHQARNSMVFELFCDTALKDVVNQMTEEDRGKIRTWEKLLAKVNSRCRLKTVRMPVVKTRFVKDEITGKEKCICVVAIGPIKSFKGKNNKGDDRGKDNE